MSELLSAFIITVFAIHVYKQDPVYQAETRCLTEVIYFEARSETHEGQLAVANVVLNRVQSKKYPDTVCEVARQKKKVKGKYICQFSYYCDGKPERYTNRKAYMYAKLLAEKIYLLRNSFDITHGSMWYHADYVQPKWRKRLIKVKQIGSHIFYKANM